MNARAVIVDGVEIPEALLAQEIQHHPSASPTEARTAASHALAIRALLLDRARAIGLNPDPHIDAQGREETPEEALVRAVLDAEVDSPRPDEAECRRVYETNAARFRTPPLYEASHILVAPRDESEADSDAAYVVAAGLIEKLRAGVCSFAELARDCSDCSSGGVGGSLGQLAPGDLVSEVEAALLALTPGAVAAAPVQSRFGWHVLRLDRRVEGAQLPFELVEDRIRLHLESRAWTAAAARYVADLAAAARAHGVALTLTADGGVQPGSATLGDFLSDTDVAFRLDGWLAAVDPDLRRRLAAAADAARESVADYARAAMADFVASANDERWTNLISAARDAQDPALACLAAVLRSKLVPAKQTFTVIRRVGA